MWLWYMRKGNTNQNLYLEWKMSRLHHVAYKVTFCSDTMQRYVQSEVQRLQPCTAVRQVESLSIRFWINIQKPPLIAFYLLRLIFTSTRQICTIHHQIRRHLRDVHEKRKSSAIEALQRYRAAIDAPLVSETLLREVYAKVFLHLGNLWSLFAHITTFGAHRNIKLLWSFNIMVFMWET